MGDLTILAVAGCDVEGEVICAPSNVNELFEFTRPLFSIGGFHFTRTVFLIFAAMLIVLGLLFFGLRRQQLVPTKFELVIESLVGFVRDDIAKGVIGVEHGAKYLPYLLSLFFFILVGNLFEITPFVNFPITSRMALPGFLAIITWVLFVIVGFAKNGFKHYFIDMIWPKSVPIALRWLVGIIDLVSVFILRPITLAVRLFANMVAGHLMLTLPAGVGCDLRRQHRQHRRQGGNRGGVVRLRIGDLRLRGGGGGASGLHLHVALGGVHPDIAGACPLRSREVCGNEWLS